MQINYKTSISLANPTSSLRKELNIWGQVGEAGQKDTLSYLSLMHQVKNTYQARYEEIVTATIISMMPSLTLWSVLEFTADLTLSQLQHWIEAHLGEQNATKLCILLTSVVQFSAESCYEFVMRSVQFQQKFMFASNESDTSYNQILADIKSSKAVIKGSGKRYFLLYMRSSIYIGKILWVMKILFVELQRL